MKENKAMNQVSNQKIFQGMGSKDPTSLNIGYTRTGTNEISSKQSTIRERMIWGLFKFWQHSNIGFCKEEGYKKVNLDRILELLIDKWFLF